MKYIYKTLVCLLTTFAILMGYGGSAQAFTTPPKPDNGWYVRDMSGKLDAPSIALLNQKIENFNKTKRNEIGILVLPTTNGMDIDDAAHDVFNAWGIGKAGLDNGILIMIASSDRKIRIETGKGAEADITDVDAKNMIDGLRPYLRSGDYGNGLSKTIDSISVLMEDRTGQKGIVNNTAIGGNSTPASNDSTYNDGGGLFFAIIIGFLFIPGVLLFFCWLDRRSASNRFNKFNTNYDYYKSTSPARPDNYTPPRPPPSHNYVKGAIAASVVAETLKSSTTKPHHKSHTPEHKHSSSGSSYTSSSSYESPSSSSSYSPPDFGSDSGSGFGGGGSGGGGADGGF